MKIAPKNVQSRGYGIEELLPRNAMETHELVGKEVRTAISRIGGTLPENIPPAEPINQVKKRLKTTQPHLALEPKDVQSRDGHKVKSSCVSLGLSRLFLALAATQPLIILASPLSHAHYNYCEVPH